ncbi:PREDICTED: contactin-5-like [Branchiostoma belcheri]|uniref:Contactin-5-like n=1 Tax=Branchiostoma belcheri TaxID=7741 RepID=A0A6P4ZR18_BRABE|nr:PREDICTED: contactin-5-like [Branchiostoma belcheri]
MTSAQNAITLPDDGITRTNLGDDSILEYGYTTAPGATMLFEVWKKMPSSGIANKANNGSFNVFAAWRVRQGEPVGQASLKLFSVTKDDAGQYQLSTTFSDGTSDSKERTLIVQFAPEDTTVTAAPGLIAKEGDAQVVLTCQSGGIPAPTYTWTGDNLPADAAQDPNTGTLTITNIQRSAAGQYTCTADNGVPQLPGDNPTALTNSVNVQVQYGPSAATITRDPADKVVQWSTVILSCAVDTANPPATYTWTRVNGTLPTNTDVDVVAGTLRLKSIQPDAVGTYQCSASNRIGDPAIATHVIDEVEEGTGQYYRRNYLDQTDKIVLGGVVAVLVFVILVAAFMLGRYLARHKGDYKTNEEKGDGEDADTALQNGDPNHPAVKKNKEWFI